VETDRASLGFLLAKASQRWNELLAERFREAGFPEVRPAYGSVLVPLFEEDALRIGELARRSRLAKQTMTTMVRLCERDGLVRREGDHEDRRATRVLLTPRARALLPVAAAVTAELEARVAAAVDPSHLLTLKDALRGVIEL
jgi:DNA-binding MarR family transcriptional regulator